MFARFHSEEKDRPVKGVLKQNVFVTTVCEVCWLAEIATLF